MGGGHDLPTTIAQLGAPDLDALLGDTERPYSDSVYFEVFDSEIENEAQLEALLYAEYRPPLEALGGARGPAGSPQESDGPP